MHLHGGDKGESALHVAAALQTNGIECAQMLLKSGAQPNAQQTDGQTPLHIAARNGNADMIRLMLKEGANPQIKSKVITKGHLRHTKKSLRKAYFIEKQ